MRTLSTSYLFRLCCHQSQVSWLAASLSQRLACFFELAFSSNTLVSAIRPFLLLHLSSTAPIPGIAVEIVAVLAYIEGDAGEASICDTADYTGLSNTEFVSPF